MKSSIIDKDINRIKEVLLVNRNAETFSYIEQEVKQMTGLWIKKH
jgi:hypothetical protein